MRASYLVALALTLTACGDATDGGDAGLGDCAVTDGSHVESLRPLGGTCAYICAESWTTCQTGPACGTELGTDANCSTCGNACRGEYHCTATSSGSHECRAP